MKKQKKQFYLSLFAILALGTLSSCAKPHALRAQQELNQQKLTPIEAELEPTYIDDDAISTDLPPSQNNTAAKLQKPSNVIKTTQATIMLGQVKMQKVIVKYDPSSRQFKVQGQAVVFLDQNKKQIIASDFNLIGMHSIDDDSFSLKPTSSTKENSDLAPVVRGQVTCLSLHEDNTIDCSNAVVDFIIAYKKQIYSEQMETKRPAQAQKVVTPEPRTETDSKKSSDQNTDSKSDSQTDNHTDDKNQTSKEQAALQSEQQETSKLGRYQGQIEVTDLKEIFDADDAIQAVLKQPLKPKVADQTTDQANDQKAEKPTEAKKEAPAAPSADKTKAKDSSGKKPKEGIPADDFDQAEPKSKKNEEPKKEDKKISPTVSQTKNGDLRPTNQAIGAPDNGKLNNATSLLEKQKSLKDKAYFEIVFPERARFYTTYEMAEMITRMGDHLNTAYQKRLAVSDISKLKGGLLNPHVSHQIGMDADLGYPATDDETKFPIVVRMGSRKYDPSAFSINKTYELLKFTFSQPDIKVDRIFIDKSIKKVLCDFAKSRGELSGANKEFVQEMFKNLEHADGHGDHFHLRLKCNASHPQCRNKLYYENAGCL